MASAQVVETSVANNSPSQDSNHPDDLFNQGMLLLGSNYFVKKKKACQSTKEYKIRDKRGGVNAELCDNDDDDRDHGNNLFDGGSDVVITFSVK